MTATSNLRIGTSGFRYKDWRGVFYPPDLPETKMLDYYVTFFDCVEINSTYYRILPRQFFASIADRTPPGFTFTVKLHRSITHDRTTLLANIDAFWRSVAAVQERGKLGGLLAQFPWSFRNSKESRDHLLLLRERLRETRLFVEFRNQEWATPAVCRFLEANGMHMCSVDEPDLPGLMPREALLTGDAGYVRFHGRNAASWWGGGVHERYDYAYSEDELVPWVDRIHNLQHRAAVVYVFFNNCHAGHAARNALLMKRLLGLESAGEQGELFDG